MEGVSRRNGVKGAWGDEGLETEQKGIPRRAPQP